MSQYAIKEVMDFVITKFHPNELLREPIVSVDYAQITEIVNGAERIEVRGGRGYSLLATFDHSKTTSVNLTLPLTDLKLLALISGDCITKRIRNIFKREVGYVSLDGSVQLKRAPLPNSLYVYDLVGTRDNGDKLELAEKGAEVERYEYKIDETDPTKLILNLDSHPVGSEVVVYYHTQTTDRVEQLQINPAKFPKAISFYGDALFRNQVTEVDEIWNVIGHKGRIRPEYTLTMSGTEVTVLELTIDLYAYKSAQTKCDTYIEYIKDESEYGDEDDCCEDDPEVIKPDPDPIDPVDPPTNPPTNIAEVGTMTAFKNAVKNPDIDTVNITKSFPVTQTIVIDKPMTVNGNSYTINYSGDLEGFSGNYIIQVVGAEGVVIKDLKLSEGDAGIQVKGSKVSIENVTTIDNEFGGIEVLAGDEGEAPELTIIGTNDHQTSDLDPQPAIWIEGKETNDGWVVGDLDAYETETNPDPEKTQLLFNLI